LKDIGYYIEISKTRQRDSAGVNKSCWAFEDDGVVLLRGGAEGAKGADCESVNELKKLGFGVCETYDTRVDDGNFYILQERAKGTLIDVRRDVEGENKEETVAETNFATMKLIAEAPQEHFDSLATDNIEIHDFGLFFDASRPNLFYDREKGFTNIDVNNSSDLYIITGIDNKEHRVNLVKNLYHSITPHNERYSTTEEYKAAQKAIKLKLSEAFIKFGFSRNELSYALDLPKSELPETDVKTIEETELENCEINNPDRILRNRDIIRRLLSYEDILCKHKAPAYYTQKILAQIDNDDIFIEGIFPNRPHGEIGEHLGSDLFGIASVLKSAENLGVGILEKVVNKPYIQIILTEIDRSYWRIFTDLEKEKQRRANLVTHREEMFELFKDMQTTFSLEEIERLFQLRPRALREVVMPQIFEIEHDFGDVGKVYAGTPKPLTAKSAAFITGLVKYLDSVDQKASTVSFDDPEMSYYLNLCRHALNKVFDGNNAETIKQFLPESGHTDKKHSILKLLPKNEGRYGGKGGGPIY
jgi:hypothetical protein